MKIRILSEEIKQHLNNTHTATEKKTVHDFRPVSFLLSRLSRLSREHRILCVSTNASLPVGNLVPRLVLKDRILR